MKWNINYLKILLKNVYKYKVRQVRVLDNKFELFVNTAQLKEIDICVPPPSYNFEHIPNITTRKEFDNNLENNQETQDMKNNINYLTIVAPMVGKFYRASSPEESPFIKILDNVTYNQTVCIIEAMKLMNEIEAEVNGKVIDILVKDGEFVDSGQPLMIVEPTINTKIELTSE